MTATARPLAPEHRNTYVDRRGQLILFDPRSITVFKPTYVYNEAARDPFAGTRVAGQSIHCSTCGDRLFNRECVTDALGRVTVYCRHGHRN